MSIIEQLLHVIAPHACVGCGLEGYLLCAVCQERLPVVPQRCYSCQRLTTAARTCASCRKRSSIYQVLAATTYDGHAKTLLHRLKFERARAGAKDIARAMSDRLSLPSDVIITHVPTAPARIRQRGYDQAALIARELAENAGLPYVPLLSRAASGRQVGQTRAVRKQQMQRAFRVIRPGIMQNRHVLLIDDVITTGATCEAAAAVLQTAGARRVSAAVFAAA